MNESKKESRFVSPIQCVLFPNSPSWKLDTRNRGFCGNSRLFPLADDGIGDAFQSSMSILLISGAIILTGILIGLFAAATAPVGYEDESGFHFGNENGQSVPSRPQAPRHHPGAAVLSPRPA
jgi:hypothetical protein